jgi:hypothetical protein
MKSEVSRRRFIKAGAAAALPASIPEFAVADGARSPIIWGAPLHMGTSMWSDVPVTTWGPLEPVARVVLRRDLRVQHAASVYSANKEV